MDGDRSGGESPSNFSTTTAATVSAAGSFGALLQSLAAEHEREVAELRAEVQRLRLKTLDAATSVMAEELWQESRRARENERAQAATPKTQEVPAARGRGGGLAAAGEIREKEAAATVPPTSRSRVSSRSSTPEQTVGSAKRRPGPSPGPPRAPAPATICDADEDSPKPHEIHEEHAGVRGSSSWTPSGGSGPGASKRKTFGDARQPLPLVCPRVKQPEPCDTRDPGSDLLWDQPEVGPASLRMPARVPLVKPSVSSAGANRASASSEPDKDALDAVCALVDNIADDDDLVGPLGDPATSPRRHKAPVKEWRDLLQERGRKWRPEGDDRVGIGIYLETTPRAGAL